MLMRGRVKEEEEQLEQGGCHEWSAEVFGFFFFFLNRACRAKNKTPSCHTF